MNHRIEAVRHLRLAKRSSSSHYDRLIDATLASAHAALAGPEEEIRYEPVFAPSIVPEQFRQVLINIMKARRPGAPVRGDESLDDLIEAVKRTEPGEWTKPSLQVYGTQTVAEWESRARAVVDPDVPVNVDAVRDYLHQALAEIDQLRETLADRDGRLADRNRELARLRGDDDAV